MEWGDGEGGIEAEIYSAVGAGHLSINFLAGCLIDQAKFHVHTSF